MNKIVCIYETTSNNEEVKLCETSFLNDVKKIEIDGITVDFENQLFDLSVNIIKFKEIERHVVNFYIDTNVISKKAFSRCDNLIEVTLPNTIYKIGRKSFFGCRKLTSIVMSNSIIEIEREAFSNCHSLTKINIPDSVTKIDEYAFLCCHSLISIALGSGLKEINYQAFCENDELKLITCNAKTAPIIKRPNFDYGIYENGTLYIPQGSQLPLN